jgi:hypothetical protein
MRCHLVGCGTVSQTRSQMQSGTQSFAAGFSRSFLNSELPKKWSRGQQGFVVNDDWLLWNLKKDKKGAQVNFAPGENK